jgi:hypothetical protein
VFADAWTVYQASLLPQARRWHSPQRHAAPRRLLFPVLATQGRAAPRGGVYVCYGLSEVFLRIDPVTGLVLEYRYTGNGTAHVFTLADGKYRERCAEKAEGGAEE